jgi:hypothetical protein
VTHRVDQVVRLVKRLSVAELADLQHRLREMWGDDPGAGVRERRRPRQPHPSSGIAVLPPPPEGIEPPEMGGLP